MWLYFLYGVGIACILLIIVVPAWAQDCVIVYRTKKRALITPLAKSFGEKYSVPPAAVYRYVTDLEKGANLLRRAIGESETLPPCLTPSQLLQIRQTGTLKPHRLHLSRCKECSDLVRLLREK